MSRDSNAPMASHDEPTTSEGIERIEQSHQTMGFFLDGEDSTLKLMSIAQGDVDPRYSPAPPFRGLDYTPSLATQQSSALPYFVALLNYVENNPTGGYLNGRLTAMEDEYYEKSQAELLKLLSKSETPVPWHGLTQTAYDTHKNLISLHLENELSKHLDVLGLIYKIQSIVTSDPTTRTSLMAKAKARSALAARRRRWLTKRITDSDRNISWDTLTRQPDGTFWTFSRPTMLHSMKLCRSEEPVSRHKQTNDVAVNGTTLLYPLDLRDKQSDAYHSFKEIKEQVERATKDILEARNLTAERRELGLGDLAYTVIQLARDFNKGNLVSEISDKGEMAAFLHRHGLTEKALNENRDFIGAHFWLDTANRAEVEDIVADTLRVITVALHPEMDKERGDRISSTRKEAIKWRRKRAEDAYESLSQSEIEMPFGQLVEQYTEKTPSPACYGL